MAEFTLEQQFNIQKHRTVAEHLAKTNPDQLCELFMELYQYHVAYASTVKSVMKESVSGVKYFPLG
jgi:hypothetical protein